MPCCAVITCKNNSSSYNLSHGGISYHRFPNDLDTKTEWILATGRQNWNPGKTATICSIHFEPHDFVKKDGGRHYLYPVAVPSRNVFSFQENFGSPNGIASQNSINSRINTIEVEITPQNSVIVNSELTQQINSFYDRNTILDPLYRGTHDEDKRIIELMQAKISKQEITIRKLKVRNYRLKKRLFSLKSMEG